MCKAYDRRGGWRRPATWAVLALCLGVASSGCWADISPETTTTCEGPRCGSGPLLTDFERLVLPVFDANGCTSCHGGSGGLFVDTQEHLLTTGIHAPVVIPCDPAGSVLVQKLRDPVPFGARMPRGGAPINDADLAIIVNWIANGADEPGSCDISGPDRDLDAGLDGGGGGDMTSDGAAEVE